MISALIMALAACADERSDPAASNPPEGFEGEVHSTLTAFGDAVRRHDIDDVVAFFDDDYRSNEASGKSAVRAWWQRVVESGLADELPLDLDSAELVVEGTTAEITYFDARGELACPNTDEPCTTPQPYLDFRLKRDDELGWLITGIPSETTSPN